MSIIFADAFDPVRPASFIENDPSKCYDEFNLVCFSITLGGERINYCANIPEGENSLKIEMNGERLQIAFTKDIFGYLTQEIVTDSVKKCALDIETAVIEDVESVKGHGKLVKHQKNIDQEKEYKKKLFSSPSYSSKKWADEPVEEFNGKGGKKGGKGSKPGKDVEASGEEWKKALNEENCKGKKGGKGNKGFKGSKTSWKPWTYECAPTHKTKKNWKQSSDDSWYYDNSEDVWYTDESWKTGASEASSGNWRQ